MTLENPATGQVIEVLEHTDDVLVMRSTYPAGGAPAPPHLHPTQNEHFEVLSGAVVATVGGERRELEEGDVLDLPAGTTHDFGGHPDRDGTVRWEVRPPQRTLAFFEALFGLANQTDPDPADFGRIVADHEAEIRFVASTDA